MQKALILIVLATLLASSLSGLAQDAETDAAEDADACVAAAVEDLVLPQTLDELLTLRDALDEAIARCTAEAAGDSWTFSVRLGNEDVYTGVELASSDKDIDAYNVHVVVAVGDRSIEFCAGDPVYAGFGYTAMSCTTLPEGEVHRVMVRYKSERWPCQFREEQPEDAVVLDCYG